VVRNELASMATTAAADQCCSRLVVGDLAARSNLIRASLRQDGLATCVTDLYIIASALVATTALRRGSANLDPLSRIARSALPTDAIPHFIRNFAYLNMGHFVGRYKQFTH